MRRELLIYNQHNGHHGDRGTNEVVIHLHLLNRVIWSSEKTELRWRRNRAELTRIPLPQHRFDRVRIEIVSWHGHGGGLSEVRLMQRDTDLLDQGRVEVSAEHSPPFGGGKLRDGVLNSDRFEAGYWLLPSNHPGWVDLHLSNR